MDGYGVMTVFYFPYTPSCEPHLTAGGVTYSATLSRHFRGMREGGGGGIRLARAQFTTERQPVLRPAVAFSKTSFKHRSVQIKGNFTKSTLHL